MNDMAICCLTDRYYHSSNVTWLEADKICRKHGKHLDDGLIAQQNIEFEIYQTIMKSGWHDFGHMYFVNIKVEYCYGSHFFRR